MPLNIGGDWQQLCCISEESTPEGQNGSEDHQLPSPNTRRTAHVTAPKKHTILSKTIHTMFEFKPLFELLPSGIRYRALKNKLIQKLFLSNCSHIFSFYFYVFTDVFLYNLQIGWQWQDNSIQPVMHHTWRRNSYYSGLLSPAFIKNDKSNQFSVQIISL